MNNPSTVDGDSCELNFSLDFNWLLGKPKQTLLFRDSNEDFVVDEIYDPKLTGEGEHFWLKIKKNGENTPWVAKALAEYFGVKELDVGFAGMKDRHAIATQWFSIYLPGKPHTISWNDFLDQSMLNAELLAEGTHSKKLKRGMHDGNAFGICLKNVSDQNALELRLKNIQNRGVPNYFGEQRFGRNGQNLKAFSDWVMTNRPIRNRQAKSMALSSARSYIFNCVLSERVQQNNWDCILPGDLENNYPSGPLWGRGRSLVGGQTNDLEIFAMHNHETCNIQSWCEKLEHSGLKQERRSLRLYPENFSWSFSGTDLNVAFNLSAGEFATSVLRELALLEQ